MFKDFALFVKYPYTAGTIGVIWLGSAGLASIDGNLPVVRLAAINLVVSCIIALIGFRGRDS